MVFVATTREEKIALFWSKVDKTGGCWLWTGRRDSGGYGRVWLDGKTRRAHRVSYELLVGEIQAGLQIDHLCRVRNCVNPGHLEPVTGAENIRRGETGVHERNRTHCPEGHPYSTENTYRSARGDRQCRACKAARERNRRAIARANRQGKSENPGVRTGQTYP